MPEIKIKTAERVVPMIYAYTTPGITYHDGYTKIGYTEQDVDTRIKQQTHTAGVKTKKEWQGTAIYDDGSGETFHDTDFHAYLKHEGVKQPMDLGNEFFDEDDRNEWFYVDGPTSKNMFYAFKAHTVIEESKNARVAYSLRAEQKRAVDYAMAYFRDNPGKAFLFNCKPRFGKTLTVYDLCVKMGFKKVLILTNRPAIANSWYSDFMRFGFIDQYHFVSNSPALKGKYKVGIDSAQIQTQNAQYIEFESLQDIKGSLYFGGKYDKYKRIAKTEWDLLVLDEAHEGVDTYKTDVALDHISRKYTLHLSGTPFKALADNKFPKEAIYNWTYADEQKAKHGWESTKENPYEPLPQLNMFTYQMSEVVRDELAEGIEVNGSTVDYAFDLNEFFSTNESGHFIHESSVDKFLNALTSQKKFPFSTPELRDELKHTLWLLNRIDSAKELAKKLKQHPVFGHNYQIIVAAGDGKLDSDDTAHQKAFDEVIKAIEKYDKTITLSVGQLTTGVTVPEWTGVLMLSNMQSETLYMQAAFRTQNPCLFHDGTEYKRKENAYVFDFDPARTLITYEKFANNLNLDTVNGGGTSEARKARIRELLNFFPVIGEDENGEMVELNAEKVLSIPRKIKSEEVVKRGFMSNFLFQNVSNIFGAPKEVLGILEQLPEYKGGKKKEELDTEAISTAVVDEEGNPVIPEERIIGIEKEIFGNKVFGESLVQDVLDAVSDSFAEQKENQEDRIDNLKETVKEQIAKQVINPIVTELSENFGDDVKKSDSNTLTRILTSDANMKVEKSFSDYAIEKKTIEAEKKKELSESTSDAHDKEIQKKYKELEKKADEKFQTVITNVVSEIKKEMPHTIVEHVETKKEERKNDAEMEKARARLRGFSRTIPSFLMAYGDENTTLTSFDKIIPDEVFKAVTSITLDQFRMLRDGGDYTDSVTGEEKHFDGHLFDEVVFDDSVKEFLNKKKELSNYFDDSNEKDIFDYIPPQKTNQIFTPKKVVQQMADMLEKENPGCYDNPNNTFIDLYMKSGLYITEIAKRLFTSKKMKQAFPDDKARLNHIFANQVYGLAPTEIIYRIVRSYVLGFNNEITIEKDNLRLADAVPYVKERKLSELLKELYTEYEGE